MLFIVIIFCIFASHANAFQGEQSKPLDVPRTINNHKLPKPSRSLSASLDDWKPRKEKPIEREPLKRPLATTFVSDQCDLWRTDRRAFIALALKKYKEKHQLAIPMYYKDDEAYIDDLLVRAKTSDEVILQLTYGAPSNIIIFKNNQHAFSK